MDIPDYIQPIIDAVNDQTISAKDDVVTLYNWLMNEINIGADDCYAAQNELSTAVEIIMADATKILGAYLSSTQDLQNVVADTLGSINYYWEQLQQIQIQYPDVFGYSSGASGSFGAVPVIAIAAIAAAAAALVAIIYVVGNLVDKALYQRQQADQISQVLSMLKAGKITPDQVPNLINTLQGTNNLSYYMPYILVACAIIGFSYIAKSFFES